MSLCGGRRLLSEMGRLKPQEQITATGRQNQRGASQVKRGMKSQSGGICLTRFPSPHEGGKWQHISCLPGVLSLALARTS